MLWFTKLYLTERRFVLQMQRYRDRLERYYSIVDERTRQQQQEESVAEVPARPLPVRPDLPIVPDLRLVEYFSTLLRFLARSTPSRKA